MNAVRNKINNKGVRIKMPSETIWVKAETRLSLKEVGNSVKYSWVCFWTYTLICCTA